VGVTSAQTCLVLTGRLRALHLTGFRVVLVASPGALLTRTAEVEGVGAHPLAMSRGIAPLSDLRSLLNLCFCLIRQRPAVTDFSTPKAGLLGNLAAWALRVPHRVYTLRGLKLESSKGWKRRLLLASERTAASCAHVVLCNSVSLRNEARVLKIAPEHKLHLLGEGSSNGVDTKRFSPESEANHPSAGQTLRRQLGIQAGDSVLGFVGRLTADKGIPELLVAFDAILRAEPHCWLLLVGWFDASEDALHPRWRAHIAAHARIRHVGFVDDTAPYYRAMDLLILPTHREGFPNVVLEAASSGVAVITTESTGARDAVVPEVTGILIPPGHPPAIVESALQLIRDPERRLRMGRAARAWVLERYSQALVLALATEFYLNLMRDGKPGGGT
jgi:glycosyltransferase involved in cell wall biosynthesis